MRILSNFQRGEAIKKIDKGPIVSCVIQLVWCTSWKNSHVINPMSTEAHFWMDRSWDQDLGCTEWPPVNTLQHPVRSVFSMPPIHMRQQSLRWRKTRHHSCVIAHSVCAPQTVGEWPHPSPW